MQNFSFSIQILPLNANTDKVLEVVDNVIEHIKGSGLNYLVGPFETTVEGNFDDCMLLLKSCIDIASKYHEDIFANVKLHYNAEKEVLTIDEKISKHIK